MSTSEYPAGRLREPTLGRVRETVALRRIPAETWALGALIVVAAAIRIITIDNQSYWMDEALTAYEAHLPFGAMINTVAHVETTPPLYFVLAWCWAHMFGTGDVALRSISTLAGIALVPIAYLAARELASRWAAVLAAAFVTCNPFLIWYSQEARSYMLLAALTAASFLWFARARRAPSGRNLAWWAGCSSLALATHFFAGFLVAPEALWLLWASRRRATWVAVGVVVLVQIAMLPLAITDTSHQTGWIASVPLTHRAATTVLEWGVSLLSRRGTFGDAIAAAALLLVAPATLLALGGDRRHRHGAAVAAAIAGFVILAPLALALIGQDYFLSRNEIPAFVPVAIVLAAACTAPRTRPVGAALAVGLIAMFSFAALYVQTHRFLQRPDWRGVARTLGPAVVPRAILAADGLTADPLKIYLPGVSWVQQRNRPTLIREIDVVGATKRLAVAPERRPVLAASSGPPVLLARPVPRTVAPPGTVLLARFRFRNWVVARFALRRPRRVTLDELAALAPQLFRHAPAALLVFTQPRETRG